MDEVTMPKAAFDAMMKEISTLQSTVDKLTALPEEKNRIILNQTGRGSGRAVRSGRISSATDR